MLPTTLTLLLIAAADSALHTVLPSTLYGLGVPPRLETAHTIAEARVCLGNGQMDGAVLDLTTHSPFTTADLYALQHTCVVPIIAISDDADAVPLVQQVGAISVQPLPTLTSTSLTQALSTLIAAPPLAALNGGEAQWRWDLSTNQLSFDAAFGGQSNAMHSAVVQLDDWLMQTVNTNAHDLHAALQAHLDGNAPLFEFEYRLRSHDGTQRWIRHRGQASYDAMGNASHVQGIQTDITADKYVEQQLRYLSTHDQLTGLPNRTCLLQQLTHALEQAEPWAMLVIDLDRFKQINGSYGHHIGDVVLAQIGERLQHCARPGDTAARLSGDEFALMLNPVADEADLRRMVATIHQTLTAPFEINGIEFCTPISVGVVLHQPTYTHPEAVLRDADIALHHARQHHYTYYALFRPAMHTRTRATLQLETDLRRAIRRREFCLYYQPIMALASNTLIGFEALVRWQHPQRGLLQPAEFIDLAEDTGLIVALGWWVLDTACEQMQHWLAHSNVPTLTISVNLSPRQFEQPDLVQRIEATLHTYSLAPHHLKIEITESVLMECGETALATLAHLRASGVQLHIDDFGTGYSSLSYLHRLPLDTIKIDRSFISRMDSDRDSREIIRTIMTLAQSMGLEVIAEGVENASQLDHLQQLQCRYGQGYFFRHPMSSDAVINLLLDTALLECASYVVAGEGF